MAKKKSGKSTDQDSKTRKKKTGKSKSEKGAEKDTSQSEELIVIDQAKNLVFKSEEELYTHFSEDIKKLEEDFFSRRKEDDIPIDQFSDFEECLPLLLEEPFEIWHDEESYDGLEVMNYIGEFEDEDDSEADPIYYVAQVYLSDDVPAFVYLHFPTLDEKLVEEYRRGRLVFDQSRMGLLPGAAEGDALSEGEELAVGLYKAMIMLRSENDIPEEDFQEYIDLRAETIEDGDEIWQNNDLQGNVLVNFIKEFPDIEVVGQEEKELFYIVATVEDPATQTHALLFSFPTIDKGLVGRYRNGENLQAEEVIQQSNH